MTTQDKIEIIRLLNIQWSLFAGLAKLDLNEKEIEAFIEAKDGIHCLLAKDKEEFLPYCGYRLSQSSN